jgi:hypothetical protein
MNTMLTYLDHQEEIDSTAVLPFHAREVNQGHITSRIISSIGFAP